MRDGTAEDIVVNGGFEEPNQNGGYTITNNIPGWSGVGIEIGKGSIYNCRWTSQVIELAGHRSYDLTQRWRFDTNYELSSEVSPPSTLPSIYFKFEFDWAAR